MNIRIDLSSDKVAGICIGKPYGIWRFEDEEKEKIENFNYAASILGIRELTEIARPIQKHTANVGIATRESGGCGILRASDFDNTDALITNEPGLALGILHADCGAVALYDSGKNAIAMIHSGRKGTQLNIVRSTIELMRDTYGSDPKDISAYLSPCICGGCYEVDEKTADEYEAAFPVGVRRSFVLRHACYRPHIDIVKTVLWELTDTGVSQDKIKTSDICTYEDDGFYSYRGGDNDLRNISLLMIKK